MPLGIAPLPVAPEKAVGQRVVSFSVGLIERDSFFRSRACRLERLAGRARSGSRQHYPGLRQSCVRGGKARVAARGVFEIPDAAFDVRATLFVLQIAPAAISLPRGAIARTGNRRVRRLTGEKLFR